MSAITSILCLFKTRIFAISFFTNRSSSTLVELKRRFMAASAGSSASQYRQQVTTVGCIAPPIGIAPNRMLDVH